MARQYVTYAKVEKGLHRDGLPNISPADYIWKLRFEGYQTNQKPTSWSAIAHDLSVDSGCRVRVENVTRWRERA